MIKVKVVIPTHKRADTITTHLIVANAFICVAESQLPAYKERHPAEKYLVHPDTVVGLAAKRQWIYEKCGHVFMLDDDITGIQRLYEDEAKKVRDMGPETAYEIIQYAGNMCHMIGKYFFGFSKNPNPAMYRAMSPIKLSGYVNGCAFGLLAGSGLRWNPAVVAVEDYFISGMNAHKHRMAFIDHRFCFVQKDTFKGLGGLSEHRTTETEKEDTDLLIKFFGSAIEKKGLGNKLSKNKNEYGRIMKIPF